MKNRYVTKIHVQHTVRDTNESYELLHHMQRGNSWR